jgi:hypothetical protein
MKTRQLTGIVCAALVLLNPNTRVMVHADTRQSVEDIRKELLQLPYYSVFDFLAFSYDRGTVVVGGYAYALGLKKDAERAIKRASGVDTVVDKIEELPANQFDDQIRWATYYKMYRDPFLSRYAPRRRPLVGPSPRLWRRVPPLRRRLSRSGARRRLSDSHHRPKRACHAAWRRG